MKSIARRTSTNPMQWWEHVDDAFVGSPNNYLSELDTSPYSIRGAEKSVGVRSGFHASLNMPKGSLCLATTQYVVEVHM